MISEILTDKLNSLSSKSSLMLNQALEQSSSVDDYLVGRVMGSIKLSLARWLANHPVIAWMYAHPLLSLLAILLCFILTLRLLATIYRAIAQAIDSLWLWILRSPWLLLKLIWGGHTKPQAAETVTTKAQTTVTNYTVSNNAAQLQSMLERLDIIQQQQQQILQELAELKQQPLAKELKQIKLIEDKVI